MHLTVCIFLLQGRKSDHLDADVATEAILRQVMNHRDAGVFQAYLNERVRCDVQAAFLGRPSDDALIKAIGHMSRFVDPRAPVGLTDSQVNNLENDSRIVKCREIRNTLAQNLRSQFGTIKKAEGSKLYEVYQEANLQLKNEKNKLRSSAKKESRKQFFDTIDTKEINEQLDLSILDLDRKDWKPGMVEHEMTERKQIADLVCYRTTGLTDEEKLDHRIRTIRALVDFCKIQEAPRRRLPPSRRDKGLAAHRGPDEVKAPKPPSKPQSLLKTQCIFCLGDLNLTARELGERHRPRPKNLADDAILRIVRIANLIIQSPHAEPSSS